MQPTDKQYITRIELTQMLGVSKDTIRNWTKNKEFPSPLENSGRVPIYRMLDIKNWLESEVGHD